jgi:Protein of unknown function (DUF3303)
MRYMVVEEFTQGARPVYERFAEKGRMMPEGLEYVDSWIDGSLSRCWQLMETEDPALFGAWTANWSDLMTFEITPVVGSAEAASRAAASLP